MFGLSSRRGLFTVFLSSSPCLPPRGRCPEGAEGVVAGASRHPLPPRRSGANFASRLFCSRLCSDARSSRAVETALGQETARSMCRFRVRKWSTPHRGVAKKTLAHPPPTNLLLRKIFAGALYTREVPRRGGRSNVVRASHIQPVPPYPARAAISRSALANPVCAAISRSAPAISRVPPALMQKELTFFLRYAILLPRK